MRQAGTNANLVPRQEGCTGEKTRRVGGAKLARGFTQLDRIATEDDGNGEVVEVSTDEREIVELKGFVVRVAPRLLGPFNDIEKGFERKIRESSHVRIV